MPSPTPIRSEFVFHGRVQGVGFRWTSASLAEAEGLEGWVRNEPDGTVRMVVEGPQQVIEGLLASIEARLPGHISHRESLETVANGEFSGFRILRG
ncbi:MAG: acylphosphatase [Phycisphaerales bacterium]|nr:acylphosphatase [Phycisphaerales bacterium]